MDHATRGDLVATVPANILLVGEYAVTQEGRLGISLAIDRRARGVLSPGAELRVEGRTSADGDPAFVWPGSGGVLSVAAESLHSELGSPGGSISIDTSEFFTPDGSKRGYGSSAVAVLLLSALWRRTCGAEGDLLQESIALHRTAQGGRGSGYDVATSFLGGTVLFSGGDLPEASQVELSWLPPLVLFRGEAPVESSGSVSRFERWMGEFPHRAAKFLDRSDQLVREIVAAESWEDARLQLEAYRSLSIELGEQIGVSAEITPPEQIRESAAWWKAVGAGNELGVAVLRSSEKTDALPDGTELVRCTAEGLQWL
jgi:phosphomevalonate kinase